MQLLVCLLFLVGLCFAHYSVTLWPGESTYVDSFYFDQHIDSLKVTVTNGDVPVAACFQGGVLLNGAITTCNGPYHYFPALSTEVLVDFSREVDEQDSDDLGSTAKQTYSFDDFRGGYFWLYMENMADNSTTALKLNVKVKYTYCANYGYGADCLTASTSQNGPAVRPFNTSSQHAYYPVDLPKWVSEYSVTVAEVPSFEHDESSSSVYVETPNMIYARLNGVPDPSIGVYDYKSMDNLTLTNPAAGTWFFYFGDYKTTNYEITPTYVNCGNYSIYNNSECVSINATDISRWNNVTSYKASGTYDYYLMTNDTLLVGVGTSSATVIGPPLFTSISNVPNNQSYLAKSDNNTVNFLSLQYPRGNVMMDEESSEESDFEPTWILAVWSFEDYYIWENEYCPKNCSSHGNCTMDNGTCLCDSGYKGLYCQSHGLPLIVIILIAIGAAIILAIVIGVPVACYIRNSRKANYERV